MQHRKLMRPLCLFPSVHHKPTGGAEECPHGSGFTHHQRGEVGGRRLLRALHRDGDQRHGLPQQRDRVTFCLPW